MRELDSLEEAVYNNGERLIPGVTHDVLELIRHRSTYSFFKSVIERDLMDRKAPTRVKVVDVGCGVGHGCHTLSEIPGAQILGVDISAEAIEYAMQHYGRSNITYQCMDLRAFIRTMPGFDYVVSRHTFEHIVNGIDLAASAKYGCRLMLEVPYGEPEGNPHHVLHGIHEGSFAGFSQAEFFFQDLQGRIYDPERKPARPNGIVCICGCPGSMASVQTMFDFPLPPWEPDDREYRHLIQQYLALQHEHQALQQSRAVIFAKELEEHPFLMKLASIGYSFMAKIYLTFRRSRD